MTIKKILISSLVAITLFACNNNSENSLANEAKVTSMNSPSYYALKTKKIIALTDSFKGFSTSAFIAYKEYVNAFGNDADHYKPKEIFKLPEVDAFDIQKLKVLEDALEIPVLDELNPLITSYKINARAFSVAISSCERYYADKGYKKDNFENGRGMHKPVIEIFARFSAVDSLLRLKSIKITEKLEQENLNRLKKEGFEVEYLSIIGKKEADKLIALLTASSYKNLEMKELEVLHRKIRMTYEKLITIKNTEAKHFNAKNLAYFTRFEQFYHAFDELYSRKKEKRAFTRKEMKKLEESEIAASKVEGSPNKVIVKYKDILKFYNELG